ncbi:MAG: prolyl oligopeptidase family serine peptidase [Phycisphaerae bacterium]|nr:prolyl oligopeptidase family serine peptidase [Phycisphaerae bacterium]
MQCQEITFSSVNSEHYGKMITALMVEPDKIGPHTGVMLFTHGWGGNRFQHQDKMEWAVDRFDLVCISVEYRQSGYDFDATTGMGAYQPYDASFYQVFDVLNGLRAVLERQPSLNRSRLFHYGGSQGGHIALLSTIFAPQTFAFVYSSSPMTHIDAKKHESAGRAFAPYELSVRNIIDHADLIRCPVYLEHGTADSNVPCDPHTRALAEKLESLGKDVQVKYYAGGEHDLSPTITKLDAFQAMAPEPMQARTNNEQDDFLAGNIITIPCGEQTLRIDWSQPACDVNLFAWQ